MAQEWYEVSVYVDMKDVILEETESLEKAEEAKERLEKKGLSVKIKHWKIENDKEVLIGEVK